MTEVPTPMPQWLEDAWLARYLDRELTPEEQEWFEVYAMERPALLDAIEADARLRDGLHVGASSAGADPTPTIAAQHFRTRVARAPALRIAASLCAAVGLGWLVGTTLSGQTEGEYADVVADPTRLVFDVERGAPSAPVVFNGQSGSDWVLVEVGVPAEAAEVRVLVDESVVTTATVTSEGFATFLLPRRLTAGHRLEIEYEMGTTVESRSLEVPVLDR
jgi:ferric-dicitrate binding protein FerR (iron transport regulator)